MSHGGGPKIQARTAALFRSDFKAVVVCGQRFCVRNILPVR